MSCHLSSIKPDSRRTRIIILIASVLLGVLTDFLFNGVLKIVWIAIYGATYLTLAAALYSRLHIQFGDRFGARAGMLYLVGCLFSHLVFVGHHETRTYSMSLMSDSRIILESPELSQNLYVTSDHVLQALGKLVAHQTVPITVQVTKDYGCIWAFKIATVAGVDVMEDSAASWVWRPAESKSVPSGGFDGLNDENSRRFWCEIKWF